MQTSWSCYIVPSMHQNFFDRSFKYKSFFLLLFLIAVRQDVNYLENSVITVVQEIELVINRRSLMHWSTFSRNDRA